MVTGPLGRAGPGPCEITSSVDRAGVHLEVELMGPCVCRHFREPDAGEKKESSIKFFTRCPSERGAGSFTRTLDIQISVYRYTFHVHWVLFSQGSDLRIRNTHLWFVEATQSLFHPQSVKRGVLGGRVCYKCVRANVHYVM